MKMSERAAEGHCGLMCREVPFEHLVSAFVAQKGEQVGGVWTVVLWLHVLLPGVVLRCWELAMQRREAAVLIVCCRMEGEGSRWRCSRGSRGWGRRRSRRRW